MNPQQLALTCHAILCNPLENLELRRQCLTTLQSIAASSAVNTAAIPRTSFDAPPVNADVTNLAAEGLAGNLPSSDAFSSFLGVEVPMLGAPPMPLQSPAPATPPAE